MFCASLDPPALFTTVVCNRKETFAISEEVAMVGFAFRKRGAWRIRVAVGTVNNLCVLYYRKSVAANNYN